MKLTLLFGAVLLGKGLSATVIPDCVLFTVPVTVSNIQQKNISGPLDFSTFDGTYNSFPNTTVSGTFNISASYCASSSKYAGRDSALQILLHGGEYNKTYWSGLKTPPDSINGSTYSWIDYATSQGYNVLAIDRLCYGNSSLPDGANVCQIQTQAAVIHALVQKARAGTLVPHSNKAFSTIVYVGHSFGSYIGAYYTNTYPSDTDATLLTGYSLTLTPFYSFAGGLQPARDFFPRYASHPPTYDSFTNLRTFTGFFYYGAYNPSIPPLDFTGSGTVTIGESLSLFAFAGPGTIQRNVRTPVFVMNGQNDELECPYTALDPLYASGGNCGNGDQSLTSQTRIQFPNARSFDYYNVPNTGHCINLHYSAPVAFEAAHKWLEGIGFERRWDFGLQSQGEDTTHTPQ